jgi:uncharacterized integral membrane protein (TIGR00698 family)
MQLKSIFLGEDSGWRTSDIVPVLSESLPGIVTAAALGVLAFALCAPKEFGLPTIEFMQYIDSLVLSIFLGMVARLVIEPTNSLPKMMPGILLAPYLFIPVGIIFYGLNLRFDELARIHSSTLIWMLLTTAFSFTTIYLLSTRVFGLSKPMASLLGAGSAVCGASAMTVVRPVVDAEPDELGTGLVSNTLLVIISLFILKSISTFFVPAVYATAAGALLQQTGFVKMAVPAGDLQDLAMAVKSARVALLIVLVPVLSYISRRKIYIPWYLILFVLVGIVNSVSPFPAAIADKLKLFYGIIFNTALVSVGMNAHLSSVSRRVAIPLLITIVIFVISTVIFAGGEHFFH